MVPSECADATFVVVAQALAQSPQRVDPEDVALTLLVKEGADFLNALAQRRQELHAEVGEIPCCSSSGEIEFQTQAP